MRAVFLNFVPIKSKINAPCCDCRHHTLADMQGLLPFLQIPDRTKIFYMTVVRDPIDRALSEFAYVRKHKRPWRNGSGYDYIWEHYYNTGNGKQAFKSIQEDNMVEFAQVKNNPALLRQLELLNLNETDPHYIDRLFHRLDLVIPLEYVVHGMQLLSDLFRLGINCTKFAGIRNNQSPDKRKSAMRELFAKADSTHLYEMKLYNRSKEKFLRKYEEYYGRALDPRSIQSNIPTVDYVVQEKYIGCFQDFPGRDLKTDLGPGFDIDTCKRACRDNSRAHTFMGLQFGGYCFCGSAPKGKEIQPRMCLPFCETGPFGFCGGAMTNAVYNLEYIQ